MKGLVSVLTPCYNGEKLIPRLLDSVLKQSYPNVEMIIIDDGSKDRTSDVINSYKEAFEERGYTLRCFRQENQGQSVAINYGLKLVEGEYLVWPDSDDFYAADDALEQMVNVLKNGSADIGFVRTLATVLNEDSLMPMHTVGDSFWGSKQTDFFEDCLLVKNNFWFCAGAYMVKMDVLRSCIPSLDIYTAKKAGQNWQLMLPVFYKRKCITIEKYCYNIVARSDSHSRGMFTSLEEVLNKFEAYENTVVATLERMILESSVKEGLLRKVEMDYKRIRMNVYVKYSKKKEASELYRELCVLSPETLTLKTKIRFFIGFLPCSNIVVKLYHKLF